MPIKYRISFDPERVEMMKNNVQEFAAPWSLLVLLMTITVGVIVFGVVPAICITSYNQSVASGGVQTELPILFAILVPLIFVLVKLFAPRKYIVTDSDIIVKRSGPDITIPIRDINNIRHISRKELGAVFRLFGVGGFCGTYGLFSSSGIGIFKGYTTNRSCLVVIEHSYVKKIVISPENPEEFVNTILQLKSDL